MTHNDLPLVRGIVVARITAARTLNEIERARAIRREWLAAFPDDHEVDSYGAFLARMEGAIRYDEGRRTEAAL